MEVKAAQEGNMVLGPLVGLAWRLDWLREPELRSSRQRLGSSLPLLVPRGHIMLLPSLPSSMCFETARVSTLIG